MSHNTPDQNKSPFFALDGTALTQIAFDRQVLFHLALLAATALALILLIVPAGSMYGSNVDWYCQHVTIADTVRKQFYATGNLLPDWSSLGSGINYYCLAYYGFLRPDILLSFLLPWVSVSTVIQGYAISEILLGTWLLYIWLFRHGTGRFYCLTACFLYLTSGALFQAHRQIMFVNYLPFLLLALMALDNLNEWNFTSTGLNSKDTGVQNMVKPRFLPRRRRFRLHMGLVFSFTMIILHSFYFFPACFAACALYLWYIQRQTAGSCPQNTPASRILLRRSARSAHGAANTGVKNRRYRRCVFFASAAAATALCMALLLPSALVILENSRGGSSSSFKQFLMADPLLGGLIYCTYGCGLTLIALFCLLKSVKRKSTRRLALVLCALFLFPVFRWILNGTLYDRTKVLIPFIPLVLMLTARTLEEIRPTLQGKRLKTFSLFMLLFVSPVLVFVIASHTESWVSGENTARTAFTAEEIQSVCSGSETLDIISSPMTSSNYVYTGMQRKTTLYSSVFSQSYSRLFYDILRMPISIRNRTAMTADVNPFQEYLMGVRYIQTSEDKLPQGYEVLLRHGDQVLAENTNVLPDAYGSTSLLSEAAFDDLSYPQNLDTLANRTIVPGISSEESNAYTSSMKEYPLPEDFLKRPSETGEADVTRTLPSALKDQILLLSFDVDYHGFKDIDVTINGIRNRLSGSFAAYPNQNTTFTYMFSQNDALKSLNIHFSKENYTIQNIKAYTISVSALNHPGIIPFEKEKAGANELLRGKISMNQDGCFVTNFAWANGYQVTVDGQKVTPLKVNKSFVGFPIKKGAHEIVITFHAPGKTAGCVISLTSLCLLTGGRILFRRRPEYE